MKYFTSLGMAVSRVTTISNCFKNAWNIGNEATLTPKIPINKDTNDGDWNKLLDVDKISDEKVILFTSYILLHNDVEICDENAGEDKRVL